MPPTIVKLSQHFLFAADTCRVATLGVASLSDEAVGLLALAGVLCTVVAGADAKNASE